MRFRARGARVNQLAVLASLSLVLSSPSHARQSAFLKPRTEDHRSAQEKELWVEHLSWEPRVFLYHNFLSPEECSHLIDKGKPQMQKSTVVDSVTGESMPSKVRTSSGMFFRRGEDAVIATIEQRIAKYTKIPVENGEGLQLLHYQASELYEPHFDYFHDDKNVRNGGQRIATMLMYLTDVAFGGETVFPGSTEKPHAEDTAFSECAQRGIAIRPRQGDAMLFYSLRPDGERDPASLHGGCPVVQGEKWSATKWLRVSTFSDWFEISTNREPA